ncbi:phage filamentation protein Fil family protein [Enterobacter roggenkampii]
MKAFVIYVKKESPAMQLASGSTGWLELPNGQRWKPHTQQHGSTDQRGSHPEHRSESGHAKRQILPGDRQVNYSRT